MIKWQNLALIKELLWNRIPAIDPITWWMRHEMLLKWINKWLLRAALTLSPSLSCPLRLNFELFATSWCGKHKHARTLTCTQILSMKFDKFNELSMVENKHVGICFNSWKSNKVVAIHFSFGSFFPFSRYDDGWSDGVPNRKLRNSYWENVSWIGFEYCGW